MLQFFLGGWGWGIEGGHERRVRGKGKLSLCCSFANSTSHLLLLSSSLLLLSVNSEQPSPSLREFRALFTGLFTGLSLFTGLFTGLSLFTGLFTGTGLSLFTGLFTGLSLSDGNGRRGEGL